MREAMVLATVCVCEREREKGGGELDREREMNGSETERERETKKDLEMNGERGSLTRRLCCLRLCMQLCNGVYSIQLSFC